ncbi:Bis(5'-nucleosyl)-tetraphosphatase PrpE [asymmetrical] [Paraliobacillus sp. PM-2]|uniref:bis(5'-nucleosyl)-tetraphosphatase PrpE n=1 Tax=Paraliobacillus sp. PM-2 TaxID=1462524 RepID=UPI00061BDC1C|nr:bis(5'-nucleosyl)-tetraphosphatase PrpE [Paraliobacillus sp. PM-2]CQR47989.1 Bis(5'-nucleosyl)-tetraphosphatase PrpE [asymmetrical] [Paraliobacillus sp. PM-2]
MSIDIIGDVHGCYEELLDLFKELGYTIEADIPTHPEGRKVIFLGDITDRGPASIKMIELVYEMVVQKKVAAYVPGNHCNKLYRYFRGNNVKVKHGLETTVAEYNSLSTSKQNEIKDKFMQLYEEAPLYLVLHKYQAVIAHAGIREDLIGRQDKKTATFVFYGDITGETHEDGRPVRRDWAQAYHGDNWIVYGHTPVKEPRIVHKTINIDTGCVFGNKLTAFRLPEETTVSVNSNQPYIEEKFSYFA